MELKSWAVIGANIKHAREAQGLTQTELADRSEINISSIFRVEKGKAVRMATVAKIAKGLDIVVDTILSGEFRQPEFPNLVVHRVANAYWFAEDDRRAKIPPDHLESYLDANERRRLGGLGFVSWFGSPPTSIMKNGPGIVTLEIHGLRFDAFNAHFYEDAVIFVLRGRVSVQASTGKVELGEGDWVGFKSANLVSIGPAEGTAIQTLPPRVLWIGANRLDRKSTRLNSSHH
jgi:transcriptional regulator with XRE-family HTH domain